MIMMMMRKTTTRALMMGVMLACFWNVTVNYYYCYSYYPRLVHVHINLYVNSVPTIYPNLPMSVRARIHTTKAMDKRVLGAAQRQVVTATFEQG